MKKFLLLLIFCNGIVQAQVGINNDNPQAALDISPTSSGTPESNDGLLIPRLDAFPATNPAGAQNSMMIYLNNNLTAVNISGTPQNYDSGFYYWDNAQTNWIRFLQRDAWKVTGNTAAAADFIGTLNNQPFRIRVNNTERVSISNTGQIIPQNTNNSVRIGLNSSALNRSAAIGRNASANFTEAVALGNDALVSGDYGVAVGDAATVDLQGGVAVGREATVNGQQGLAIGYRTDAIGANSTAVGSTAVATGTSSLAVGLTALGVGANSVAAGNGAEARGGNTTAVGTGAIAGTLVGSGSASAFGFEAVAEGLQSFAGGFQSVSSGAQSLAIGVTAMSTGSSSIAIGRLASATQPEATAIGYNASATNTAAIAIGFGASSTAYSSTALGVGAMSLHQNSTALGPFAQSSRTNQVVLGNSSVQEVFTNGQFITLGGIISNLNIQCNAQVRGDTFFATGTNTTYADYVFEDYFKGASKINSDYKFNTLEEAEAFVKKNGHLPGVKSYDEVMEGGFKLNLADTSIKNLEKIEEQFLYITELNAKLKAKDAESKIQNDKIKRQEEKIKSLEERLQKIEALLEK